jgi:hypothetical protein
MYLVLCVVLAIIAFDFSYSVYLGKSKVLDLLSPGYLILYATLIYFSMRTSEEQGLEKISINAVKQLVTDLKE